LVCQYQPGSTRGRSTRSTVRHSCPAPSRASLFLVTVALPGQGRPARGQRGGFCGDPHSLDSPVSLSFRNTSRSSLQQTCISPSPPAVFAFSCPRTDFQLFPEAPGRPRTRSESVPRYLSRLPACLLVYLGTATCCRLQTDRPTYTHLGASRADQPDGSSQSRPEVGPGVGSLTPTVLETCPRVPDSQSMSAPQQELRAAKRMGATGYRGPHWKRTLPHTPPPTPRIDSTAGHGAHGDGVPSLYLDSPVVGGGGGPVAQWWWL